MLLLVLPVVAAQFYNLAPTLLTWLTAVSSVALLAVVISQILSKLSSGWVRNMTGLLILALLAIYLFGQLVSYYLQGTYYNQQLFYHANIYSITETWTVYWPFTVMFVLWVLSLLGCFSYFSPRLPRSRVSFPALALLLVVSLGLDPGLRQVLVGWITKSDRVEFDSLAQIDWPRLGLNSKAVRQQELSVDPGKNLVLIYMEGLEKIYTDESIFPDLTPNIKRLEQNGWQLENLVQVEGSSWTMGGIVSSLCGTPLMHDLGISGNAVLFTHFLNQARCLPDILQEAGYVQTFIGGASLNFAGKGNFFRAHGFDQVLGRKELMARLNDPDYIGGWGLFDDSLFDLALEEFDMLASSRRPFNLTLLTVDTHHPTGEPSASCRPFAGLDNSILDAVHCTDQLVGDFVSRLKEHPVYESTVIVLLTDHLAMRNSAFPLYPKEYDRRLYFNAINTQKAGVEQRLATPMDIAPTLLDLIEVNHNAQFLAGASLLKSDSLAFHEGIDSAVRNNALRFINSEYLSSRTGKGEVLFSLEQVQKEDLVFSRDVSWAELSADGLRVVSEGSDPFVILPELSVESSEDARLFVDVETAEPGVFKIYYRSDDQSSYSEVNTIEAGTIVGNNELSFRLDGVNHQGRLRIDPGSYPGTYLIRRIELRAD
jgi:hypothetical protein